MELRHLRYFVEIAEQGHYGKAAKNLYVSQPTLSQQIQSLENEIGVELFLRSKRQIARKVELTEAGAEFLREAKKILDLSQKAIEQARKTGLHKQVLRFGAYKLALRERIVETIKLLTIHFPDVDIKLVELPTSADIQTALMDETIDLGLIVPPVKHNDLSSKMIKKGHLCVILPQNHLLANVDVVPLIALKEEKWVELNAQIHPFFEEIEHACRQAGFSRKNHIVQEVSSLELLASLVNVGIGIAFVSSLYDLSRETNIVVKPVIQSENNPLSMIEINNALAYKTGKNTPLIQALIGFLQS